MVLEKFIFNVINAFSLFHYYLPMETGLSIYLAKPETPFTYGCLTSMLVIFALMVLEKTMKMRNVNRRTAGSRRTSDDQKISGELKKTQFLTWKYFHKAKIGQWTFKYFDCTSTMAWSNHLLKKLVFLIIKHIQPYQLVIVHHCHILAYQLTRFFMIKTNFGGNLAIWT